MAADKMIGLGTLKLGSDSIVTVTEVDWDGVCATHETTGIDCAGFEEHIKGVVGATGSATVVWVDTPGAGKITAPAEGMTGDLELEVKEGTVVGPYRKAAVVITGCRIRVSPKGEVSASIQFQATGPILRVKS